MDINTEFFKKLVSIVGGGIVFADYKGNIVFANDAIAEMLLYSKEEMRNMTVASITDPSDISSTKKVIKNAIDNPGVEVQVEKIYIKKNGEKLYGVATVKSHELDGKIYLSAFINDFSDQYLARQRAQKQLENIIELADDIIFSVDVQGNFKYVNQNGKSLTEYSEKELMSLNYLDLVSSNYKEEVAIFFHNHFFSKKDKVQSSFQIETKSGKLLWLDQKLTTVWADDKQTIVGYSAVARDITKKRELAEQLAESKSHYQALFDNSPVSKKLEDFSQVKKYIEVLKNKGIKNFDEYFLEHQDKLNECIALVKILEQNTQALSLFGAETETELRENIDKVFTFEMYSSFKDCLVAMVNGESVFETSSEIKTIRGERKHVLIKWMIMPGYEDTLEKVMTTIIDVTESVLKEEEIKKSEAHYQALFMDSPIPLWLEDLSEVMSVVSELKHKGVVDFKSYFDNNLDVVIALSKKIKVLQVNQKAIELHKANSLEELFENFSLIFSMESIEAFKGELLNLINGVESKGVNCLMNTIDGDQIVVNMRWSMMPGYEKTYDKVFVSTLDITDQYRIQEKIKKSEEMLSTVFDNIGVPILISDPKNCQIIEVSSVAVEHTGFSRSELLKMNISDLDYLHNRDYVVNALNRCYKEGVVEGVSKWQVKSGEVRDISIKNSLINLAGEDRILSACTDITEIKKLNSENERFRIVMDDAPFAIYITDLDRDKFIDVNDTAARQLGYSKSELLKLTSNEIEMTSVMQDEQERKQHYNHMIQSEEAVTLEGVHRRKDGSTFPVLVTVNTREIEGVYYAIASVFDDTESKETNKRLKELNIALKEEVQFRKLVQKHSMNAEEKERKRVARDLHDGLGQRLTAVKLSLGAIQNTKKLDKISADILSESIKLVEGSMSEVRAISQNLLPVVLSDFGLEEALKVICNQVSESTAMQVDFKISGKIVSIDDFILTSLYRIAQECINNAVKYSKSDNIIVEVTNDNREKSITLTVQDFGIGFDSSNIRVGMGLNNIKERAEMIKADVEIKSILDKGSIVRVKYLL